jgi:hypothetical protein
MVLLLSRILFSEDCLVVLSAGVAKDTVISFKVERTLKTKLVALAASENRSLSNFIEMVLKEEIRKREQKPAKQRTL